MLGTKLVVDMSTGLSKGFGFVKFGDEKERDAAMSEMHSPGVFLYYTYFWKGGLAVLE